MDQLQRFETENRVPRWGGLAGLIGGVLFIIVFGIVGVFVGAEPAGPDGAIARFPDIRAARTVENGLYLVVLALWAIHVVALFRALRETSLAPALVGGALGILGLAVLAAGALPHAASVAIADLYHAPGATPADQATLALIWQGTEGIFNALLVTGLVILPMSLLAFGAAMLGDPAFGKRYGRASDRARRRRGRGGRRPPGRPPVVHRRRRGVRADRLPSQRGLEDVPTVECPIWCRDGHAGHRTGQGKPLSTGRPTSEVAVRPGYGIGVRGHVHHAARMRRNSVTRLSLPAIRRGTGMSRRSGSTISSGSTRWISRPRVRISTLPAAKMFWTHWTSELYVSANT